MCQHYCLYPPKDTKLDAAAEPEPDNTKSSEQQLSETVANAV